MNRTNEHLLACQTKRLTLRILQENDAQMVLDFQGRNASVFEQYEPIRPSRFYTLTYQRAILAMETKLLSQKSCVRFWVFEQDHLDRVIGTISFNFVQPDPFHSCQIGYKFDPAFWHQGYAAESLQKAIELVSIYLDLHRIEAFVLPDNKASCHLLEKLDFQREGLAKRVIQLDGVWTDHYRYALILES